MNGKGIWAAAVGGTLLLAGVVSASAEGLNTAEWNGWTELPQGAQAQTNGDTQVTAVVPGEAGLRCDTCATEQIMIQSAAARFPRVQNTTVYVVNLPAARVVAVRLNYLGPGEQDINVVPVDPLITRWIQQASLVYLQNGRSLNLRLVARGDGSMYWVRANGTIEELKDPDSRLDGGGGLMPTAQHEVTDAPPNSAPIDLRGYQFNEPGFSQNYPNFPRTSYDYSFAVGSTVDGFVRDQTAAIQYGTATGVINGTVSSTAGGGVTTPVASATGGVTTTNTSTSTISVYVPMKDGGFALVLYDKKTGIVTLAQLYDGQGRALPTDHPSPQTYLPNSSPFNFNHESGNGPNAFNNFRDWGLRNGIPIVNATPWYSGTTSCTWRVGSGGAMDCKQPY